MRRIALAGLLIAALAPTAFANGRAPGTSTIHFRQGHEQDIAAGMTFGLLLSHDGGTTWHWMCEAAVGYGGLWDPAYVYAPSGTLFATTFGGFKAMRDGCTFVSTPRGNTFMTADALASDGRIAAAASDSGGSDDHLYTSTDDVMTFATSTAPPAATVNDYVTGVRFAPSSPSTLYMSAYRFGGAQMQTKQFLLYKSIDAGATLTAISLTGLPASPSSSSQIDVVGVDPSNANIVYVRVTYASGGLGDKIYKSTNGGGSWTTILSKADSIAFLARGNGELIAGTKSLGAFKSTDGGTSWTALTNPPHINCLSENAAGEVWACTQNYGDTMANIPSDGYGIMKSTDLATWTGVLRYQDIQDPVMCAAGTMQQDMCVKQNWCGLEMQLGITSTAVDCSAINVDGAPDAGSGSGSGGKKDPKGCCDSGPGSAPPLVLGLLVTMGLLRRPRRPKEM